MIIGSNAIKYWFFDFPRTPKDLDFVVWSKNNIDKELLELQSNSRTEILENPVLIEWVNQPVCPPNELYTLKISHSFWDLKNNTWNKHLWDIQWLKEKGCKFIPELFYQLYEYWNNLHGENKRSNLQMTSEEFFNNAVNFPINHDYLHELLIKNEYFCAELPTYQKILKDGKEVEVCEKKI